MINQDNIEKNDVSCTIKEGKRVYHIMKDGEEVRSLSIDDRGYVFLKDGSKTIAELIVHRDKRVQNIGGCEQYQIVMIPIDVGSIEGLMDVYKKIDDGRFDVRDMKVVSGKEKEKLGKLMTSFLDTYIFNYAESRAVLNEYLNKHTKNQPNVAYLKSRNSRVDK